MTLHDRFEARYPCPEGVHYDESANRYRSGDQNGCHRPQLSDDWQQMWEVYQAAMEDAGDNWDRRVMDAMDAFDVAEGFGCHLEGQIRDALSAAVPEIAPQPDNE